MSQSKSTERDEGVIKGQKDGYAKITLGEAMILQKQGESVILGKQAKATPKDKEDTPSNEPIVGKNSV